MIPELARGERGRDMIDRGPDGYVQEIMASDFRKRNALHEAELEAKIAMGWGDTPQGRIPADWRTRRGKEQGLSPLHRANIAAGIARRKANQTSSGEHHDSSAKLSPKQIARKMVWQEKGE